MFQEFYTDSVISRFIKELLYDTAVPSIDVVNDGDTVYKGVTYIYNNKIVIANKTASIKPNLKDCTVDDVREYLHINEIPFLNNHPNLGRVKISVISNFINNAKKSGVVGTSQLKVYIKNNIKSILPNDIFTESEYITLMSLLLTVTSSNVSSDVYREVSSYHFGDYIPQYTEKYISKYNYYDSETHKMLGKYLRFIKGMTGVDLLPYYNCFTDKIVTNYYIDFQTETITPGTLPGYKLYAVPVKIGRTYTIAIDCPTSVLMKTGFYNESGLLEFEIGQRSSGIRLSSFNTFLNMPSMSFNSPIQLTIQDESVLSNINYYKQYENTLYLFIQLPAQNDSSIIVLDGKYRNKPSNVIGSTPFTYPSLLIMNTRKQFAFSDRLIEYLLSNVINSSDAISENITRVQNYIGYTSGITGVWDDNMRSIIFEKANLSNHYDVSGYVDKNVEKELTKGFKV